MARGACYWARGVWDLWRVPRGQATRPSHASPTPCCADHAAAPQSCIMCLAAALGGWLAFRLGARSELLILCVRQLKSKNACVDSSLSPTPTQRAAVRGQRAAAQLQPAARPVRQGCSGCRCAQQNSVNDSCVLPSLCFSRTIQSNPIHTHTTHDPLRLASSPQRRPPTSLPRAATTRTHLFRA